VWLRAPQTNVVDISCLVSWDGIVVGCNINYYLPRGSGKKRKESEIEHIPTALTISPPSQENYKKKKKK
jgi:hypothetical protein